MKTSSDSVCYAIVHAVQVRFITNVLSPSLSPAARSPVTSQKALQSIHLQAKLPCFPS